MTIRFKMQNAISLLLFLVPLKQSKTFSFILRPQNNNLWQTIVRNNIPNNRLDFNDNRHISDAQISYPQKSARVTIYSSYYMFSVVSHVYNLQVSVTFSGGSNLSPRPVIMHYYYLFFITSILQ